MARPRSLALAIVGAALATIGSAKADDPVCDYDVTILDATARKVEIAATCDPRSASRNSPPCSDRALWWMRADSYGGGKGRFTFELAQFADRENDMGSAMTMADAVMVTPGYLLPLPNRPRRHAALSFHISERRNTYSPHCAPMPRAATACRCCVSTEVGPLVLGAAHRTPDRRRSGTDPGSARGRHGHPPGATVA